MKNNQDFKNEALAALRGNWAQAVLASIAIILVAGCGQVLSYSHSGELSSTQIAISAVTMVLSIFILYPFEYSFYQACRLLLVNGNADMLGNSFRSFFGGYGRLLSASFAVFIKTFLWTLLLIIPGIVKGLAYSMTPYVLMDHPEYRIGAAIKESERIMVGHKFDLFYLELSFIGWIFLSILTLGIGLFWLIPYMRVSVAAFYEEVKG